MLGYRVFVLAMVLTGAGLPVGCGGAEADDSKQDLIRPKRDVVARPRISAGKVFLADHAAAQLVHAQESANAMSRWHLGRSAKTRHDGIRMLEAALLACERALRAVDDPAMSRFRDRLLADLHDLHALPDMAWGPSFTNSVGMRFVYIRPGRFRMGSDRDKRRPDERPTHEVRVSAGFYMGAYEVTQGQFLAVMGENPSDCPFGNDYPVDNLRWCEAQRFCDVLSERDGRRYRLPTEAEWEYACRAGSSTRYSFGDSDYDLREFAWHGYNSGKQTQPVGRKRPNAWGLFDMHGNVWEWCHDWYTKDYYSRSPRIDPTGPTSGTFHVIRGGSFLLYPRYCRSAVRRETGKDRQVGFRVVCEAGTPTVSASPSTASALETSANRDKTPRVRTN